MWWLVAYCTAVSILGFPSAAHAYIDPGSGSLLLQSFAFLFLLAGVFFRNMRNFAEKYIFTTRWLRRKR